MQWPITFLLLTILFYIGIQDFKHRAISWWTIPLLFILMLLLQREELSSWEWVKASLINLVFLLVNGLIITLYYSLKERKWVNIIDQKIGWGDILFMGAVSFFFSFPNMLLFMLTCLLLAILIAFIQLALLKREQNYTVPLAGIMAVVLAIVTLINSIWKLNVYRDEQWVLQYITE